MVTFRHVLLILVMGVAGDFCLAASIPAPEAASLLEEFTVARWQVEEGLPDDSVLDLQFSSDGYLWCLAEKKLSRFDGVRFESLDWPSRMEAGGWSGLDETSDSTLWVHGVGGACNLSARQTGKSIWAGTPVPPRTPVQKVVRLADKSLWAVVSNGLYQVNGRNTLFYKMPGPAGAVVEASEFGPGGMFWLATGKSILTFCKGHFVSEPLPGGTSEVLFLTMGNDGMVWAATASGLLCREGGRWKTVSPPPHRSHPRWRITALYAFDVGELWVGTTSGLWRRRDNGWSALTPRDGYFPLEIQCISRDPEGNIWAGSSGGLIRLRRKAVQTFGSGLALPRHSFTAVLPAESGGAMLAGVAGGGLLEGVPGSFKPYGVGPISGTAVISALLKSHDGTLWIGTQGDYLWRFRDGRADCMAESPRGENSAVNINALLEDRQGRIWVGTVSGLMRLDDAKGLLDPVEGAAQEARVHALLEDRDGSIWAGFQGEGLIRIPAKGTVSVFRREQGLPSSTVMALCQDADGVLWAGTTGGLGRWDGYKWTAITEKQGLPEGPVTQLLEDGPNLWVGTRYGIARLTRGELAEVAAGLKDVLVVQPFGRNEGMREEQCASGFGNLAARDAAGALWFSTLDGLVKIDPNRVVEKNHGGLRVYIEEIHVGESPVLFARAVGLHEPVAVTLQPGEGPLAIQYAAPFFSAPEQVQFKHRLEGYDLAWSAPTASRSAVYTRLPPGKYRFRVMAGIGGAWRESAQGVAIEVRPYPWQQPWFWVLAGSLLLAWVWLGVRAQEKRRSRLRFEEMERQRALERERSRIAHDLHDDLGAALTEVGLLSAVAQRPTVSAERARHYLGEIAEKIRVMVETLDEIVWAINPRNDTVSSLGNYFCECAQRMLQLTPIRCRLDLAPDLPAHPLDPDRRHNLFLAFSEALNNVIRHSGATEAVVRISGDPRQLVVTVEDNGRGLTQGPVSEGAEGLNSMCRRLERMGGRCEITGRDGQGTTVRFIVPLG